MYQKIYIASESKRDKILWKIPREAPKQTKRNRHYRALFLSSSIKSAWISRFFCLNPQLLHTFGYFPFKRWNLIKIVFWYWALQCLGKLIGVNKQQLCRGIGSNVFGPFCQRCWFLRVTQSRKRMINREGGTMMDGGAKVIQRGFLLLGYWL